MHYTRFSPDNSAFRIQHSAFHTPPFPPAVAPLQWPIIPSNFWKAPKMTEIAPGWSLEWQRVGDWLQVHVMCQAGNNLDDPPLAENVWSVVQEAALYRLVLDFSQVETLRSYLIGQLVLLQKRICGRGGLIRLSGMSERNRETLHHCRLDDHLPCAGTFDEAVRGVFQSCRK